MKAPSAGWIVRSRLGNRLKRIAKNEANHARITRKTGIGDRVAINYRSSIERADLTDDLVHKALGIPHAQDVKEHEERRTTDHILVQTDVSKPHR
jgi:hypothetical protein